MSGPRRQAAAQGYAASGPSRTGRALTALLALSPTKRRFSSPEKNLRRVAELEVRPESYRPPRWLGRDLVISVRHDSGWPVYRVSPAGPSPRKQAVYVHGGAWMHEISALHWRLVARIARRTRTTVTVPIYPLVPWGTAGSVVPVVADLVSSLTTGYGPEQVTVLGDSAGGQIALSAALVLRDRGAPPHRTVLISPALDLTFTDPDLYRIEPHDPILGIAGTAAVVRIWAGDLPVTDPVVSPLLGDLSGLGPIRVFSGTRDLVHPDSVRLVARAQQAGVDVEYHEAAEMPHVYPLMPVPEGRAARRQILAELE